MRKIFIIVFILLSQLQCNEKPNFERLETVQLSLPPKKGIPRNNGGNIPEGPKPKTNIPRNIGGNIPRNIGGEVPKTKIRI